MMRYWSDGTPWWGWVVMCGGMIAFWAAAIGAIWYAVTHAGRDDQRSRERSPQMILDERFARGEIDAAEYAAGRDALCSTHGDRMPTATGPAR